MNRSTRLNRALAALLGAAVLFCRVALATVPCPTAMVVEPAMQMADCAESNATTSPLCQKSCNDDAQTFQPDVPAAIPSPLDSSLRVVPPAPVAVRTHSQAPLLARANAPPLIVLFGRIRE